ncbi:hypothetical protein N7457_001781 [Penicillium paradoxum]|uniref:uncharacterized protein n=1 Tax=Penicillium paradoxum TaxID=176176 RepID=UPI0025491E79|nr:uncharacterized protein N7457_001781 [Penicillium paradoxum]KAJ5795182.1 hypothetical protein N7457_001781 [Penicillium paradoxum]
MSQLFCCTNVQPINAPKPDHEHTFNEFTKWAKITITNLPDSTPPPNTSLGIQLVQQATEGPIESVRYFVATDKPGDFEEFSEEGILNANFAKVNERQTFQCNQHSQTFYLNLYERGENANSHHWRANIAKPLKKLEHAFKSKTQSGFDPRSALRAWGSVRSNGPRASSAYEYAYGLEWESHLGSDWGSDWGTGNLDITDKDVASLTKVEIGSSDSDSEDPGQDLAVPLSNDDEANNGVEDGEQADSEDQGVSSPTLDDEAVDESSSGDDETMSYSSSEIQAIVQDSIVEQSYLDVEDYGFYDSGLSADDYGGYHCDGSDQDLIYIMIY